MTKYFILILVSIFILSSTPCAFAATDEEIQALKVQVRELMQRIEKLETEQIQSKAEIVKAKEEAAKAKEVTQGRVDLANALSKLKLKGRAALGFFDSGKAVSYQSGSFEMPDAKIQFAFQPDDINTVTLRFNLNNATAQSPLLDYFFLTSKDFFPSLKNTPFSLSSRLGRFKLGFGEETWSDNPIEGILPSNSAGKVGATDEGLELAGKIKLDKIKIANYTLQPLGWVISASNGNSGVSSDSSSSKAFMGKLYYTPIEPLYLSTSYYDSGNLKITNSSEMSIAGLASRPSGANDWKRKIWEVDVRYDFGKGKKPLDPPVFSDSKAILRLSYGAFHDGYDNNDRKGDFGFVDGIYNLGKKYYIAGRYSVVDIFGDATAALNSVTTNKYCRQSLGAGYRWSENTILKLGYDWNENSGASTEDADDNLLSAIVATQF